ncbi:uncharacterized protein LOC110100310 [Dendrobium catenatum]|uniref:DUF2828 domain-containing protein n=1 Tax=Dendrobium catenatum TaxID=906689 RepID=A0A2I0W0A5_9ASPA|nr:uncharacterized protein LOC110100310 [Dendrobium catenatum]PKU69095.1 hypothetical protein MA16_Dca002365 [Dendrobium catenatum]
MAAQTSVAGGLLGPPEIRHPPSPSSSAEKKEVLTGDPFVDLMDTSFNSSGENRPLMGLTENASPTFISTGNPHLDFFFHVVPDSPRETVTTLLSAAWDRDPLTALKLVFQLRGVRGTGKSDRESFYSSALWLHLHHPKTLALNLPSIAEFGYFKDLPEILHRLIDGPDTRKLANGARANRRKHSRRIKKTRGLNKKKKQGTKEERLAAELARVKLEMDSAASLRRKKRNQMACRAVDRYNRDPHYRFLHDRVSEHFATMLAADISHLTAGNLGKLSLAAKWCPSLDTCFDRSTLLCESIARRLFPRESDPDLAALEDAHYAYRIRDRLRRALVPLRRALQIPEVYMSAGQWDSLPYSRVPSVAMKNYKDIFEQHDETRFNEYLDQVKEGKAKIAAGALLPHEILAPAAAGEDDEVAELQWRRMVADMAANGRLQNCIAVCDVSGSMCGIPMEVCVALGLLVSELSDEPWKGRVITFSENPQLHKIEGTTIKEKTNFVRQMEWGMNTDLQKVFDRLLEVAVEGKLLPEKMIKRIFIFSDMEFDMAGGGCWETDYEVICRKFKENGYESAVPEIVFWNLRSSQATPVPATKPGVALVSGFSKNLMKLFLEGAGVINPVDVMESAIAGDEYKGLKVFD